jgi:hypothetical protein
MDFKTRADALLDLGVAVFPLQPGTKIPYPKTRGVKEASKNALQIDLWAKRWPDANVAIACGEISGIFVVDVDPRHGGDKFMMELQAKGRMMPKGPLAITGNGGLHHFLRYEPGIKNGVNAFREKPGQQTGIDIRSNGGYVVGAGSAIDASESGPGGEYTWRRMDDLPRAPIWLTAALRPIERPRLKSDVPRVSGEGAVGGIIGFAGKGQEGERNNRLYWAAQRMKEQVDKGRIGKTDAEGQLLRSAMNAGLPADEARKTINSALDGNLTKEG